MRMISSLVWGLCLTMTLAASDRQPWPGVKCAQIAEHMPCPVPEVPYQPMFDAPGVPNQPWYDDANPKPGKPRPSEVPEPSAARLLILAGVVAFAWMKLRGRR